MNKSIFLKLSIIILFIIIGYWAISQKAEAPVIDSSMTEDVLEPTTAEDVAKIFAQEYEKDVSEVIIQFHNETDDYLRGTVIFEPGGSENTALFLASRLGNTWDIVFEGNSAPDCSAIMAYNFPREFLVGICDKIFLKKPLPSQIISSPLHVEGEARGTWFFEASFPVVLTNWDGLIITEGYATAQDEWMTDDLVPFTADVEFVSPAIEADQEFMKYGLLILQKDNPSGLPENDDALEIPIRFVK